MRMIDEAEGRVLMLEITVTRVKFRREKAHTTR